MKQLPQVAWPATALLLIQLLQPHAAAHAQAGQPKAPSAELLAKFKPTSYTPPEIKAVEVAEAKHDFKLAKLLEDEIINRSDLAFETRWQAQWIKSLALRKRFSSRQALGEPHIAVLPDLMRSARYGNLKAIRQAEDILEEYLAGMNPAEYPPLTAEDIGGIFRLGAALGDFQSQFVLGSGSTQLMHVSLPVKLAPEERVYWLSVAMMNDPGSAEHPRRQQFQEAVARIGIAPFESGVARYGLTGGVVAASTIAGLPGRDVYAAYGAEHDLRGTYAGGFGAVMPPDRPNIELSAREYFSVVAYLSALADSGRMFLLVPGTAPPGVSNILGATREAIAANILPDDNIVVRCGPLSHVAVVFKVDRAADKIYLADPLYQFWQPSHNACSTAYALVDGPAKGYLVVVSLKDVTGMLQALVTRRTDITPRAKP